MTAKDKLKLKSRSGCAQCKRRKVKTDKCDEAHPVCRNCKRFGDKCAYPSLQSSPATAAAATPPTPTEESLKDALHDVPRPPDTSQADSEPPPSCRDELELMHQFTAFTSVTMFDTEEKRSVFQRYAPRVALDKPYLLYAMYAVAASHIYDTAPPPRNGLQRYIELAAWHHARALAALPSDIQKAVERDFEPIFAFSGLLAIHSFTLVWQDARRDPESDVLASVNHWTRMIKGVESVVWGTGVADRLMSGQFEILFRGYVPPLPEEVPLSPEVVAQLDGLCQLADWHEGDSVAAVEVREAYHEAVDFLRQAHRKFCAPLGRYCRVSAALSWPTQLRPQFLTALSEGKPPAVLIMMHFFVLMHRLKSYWWIDEGPAIMCRRLAALLPESVQDWKAWPLERTEQ